MSFKSKIINDISSTVLGTCLLHDNFIIRYKIWNKWSPNSNFLTSNYLPLHFIIKVYALFVVGTIIDIIRKKTVEQF